LKKDKIAFGESALPAQNNAEANGGSLLHARKVGIKEASKMVGVGETKMREFIRKGELPVLLIDGKYLLLEHDLELFLSRHYGRVKKSETKPNRMPSLPRYVAESELLKRRN
jgi:hypothetical protein